MLYEIIENQKDTLYPEDYEIPSYIWYRYSIAVKHGIANFKPIILFRSKTIDDSKSDYQNFLELCKNDKNAYFQVFIEPKGKHLGLPFLNRLAG